MDLDQFKNIICEVSNADPDEITEDTTFADDLGLDSLDMAQIIFAVEEQLDIEVNTDMLEEIVTVGDALEAIQEAQS